MTFFVGVLDFSAGTLTYSSAGHNPPWLFTGGNPATLKSLAVIGPRLGERLDERNFKEQQIAIGVGDVVFLYTDGILEGKNAEGTDMFGKRRTLAALKAGAPQGPKAMLETMMSTFATFNGEKEFDDDVTLATVTILKTGEGV